MRKLSTALLALALLLSFSIAAQDKSESKKDLTLEDIWSSGQFYPETVRGLRSMNDGAYYTALVETDKGEELNQYSYETGKKVGTLITAGSLAFEGKVLEIDDYTFSADEKKVMIATEEESIYRHSTKAQYFAVELNTKKVTKITDGEKQMYATFSPSGNKVAFVKENNLYYVDLEKGKEVQITKDGEFNKVINGASDWVYEEELVLVRSFEWSPDGKRIAFYRFDEAAVKQFAMPIYGKLYPDEYRFKYPKAGEENAKVSIHIFDLDKAKTVKANFSKPFEYLTAMKWTAEPNVLAVYSSNRHQSQVDVNLVGAESGNSAVVYTEKSPTYVEMPFDVTFLPDKKRFIVLSEKSGYNHLYLYSLEGERLGQITEGEWDITEFYGYDEKSGFLYYQAAEKSPLMRHVYRIDLEGKNKSLLTPKEGTNNASFSTGFKYFINTHTTANKPHYVSLHQADGKEIRVLKDNKSLQERLSNFNFSPKEFFKFKTSQGTELNGWMIRPPGFDKSKEYPLFLTIYGGPGSQTVKDSWGYQNYFWHQLLAQKGYIVVSIDNRGTGARGREFKTCTYQQLGKLETEDQIEAAKYLGSLPYVDKDRIGVQGWSYGGYMSSLCLLKGADYFKAAIAVAPVTNWRFYDTIYTERYMRTPQENPNGYDDNSPINHVEKLRGNYLLIHGTADDNVHFQNTTEMISALAAANKQFDLFIYPNKNHGIYGGNTRLHLYQKMTDFLLEKL